MQRRNFLKQNILVSGAVLSASNIWANDKNSQQPFVVQKDAPPFKMNYGIHDGMLSALAGNSFIDQIKFAHSVGFRAIEDNGMMDRTPEMQQKIGDTLRELGMSMGVFVLNFDHWPVKTSLTSGSKEWREKFLSACKEAVAVSKRCNGNLITVVPGNYARDLKIDIQTANVIEALRPGIEWLEKHNIVVVLEPLSDTPDLFLRYSDQTYAICKALNSPSCKILYDIYHMQRNEGNLIKNIDACWDEIGYIQIGDNPGRNEPGTGEINYKNVFKHLHAKGYKGVLGMEHGIAGNGKEGALALIEAYRLVDNF